MNKHQGFVFIEGAALLGVIAIIAAAAATASTAEKQAEPVSPASSTSITNNAELKIAATDSSRDAPTKQSPE